MDEDEISETLDMSEVSDESSLTETEDEADTSTSFLFTPVLTAFKSVLLLFLSLFKDC